MDSNHGYTRYVGGILFCIQSIPQIHKVFKTRSTNDLSCLSLLGLAGGLSSTLLLSVNDYDLFFCLTYGIGLVNVNILLFMKQYYDGLPSKKNESLNSIDIEPINYIEPIYDRKHRVRLSIDENEIMNCSYTNKSFQNNIAISKEDMFEASNSTRYNDLNKYRTNYANMNATDVVEQDNNLKAKEFSEECLKKI